MPRYGPQKPKLIPDITLATILGFKKQRNIRDLVSRNLSSFPNLKIVVNPSPNSVQPKTQFFFNEAQALKLFELCKTRTAKKLDKDEFLFLIRPKPKPKLQIDEPFFKHNNFTRVMEGLAPIKRRKRRAKR